MAHPRAVPLPPARFVLFKPCSSHARRPYHPASLASGASSVRSSQGALSPRFPAGQHRAGHLGTGKGEARAAPTRPGRGPKLVKGRPQVTPAGRKLPPVLIRIKEADPPGATRTERLGERWGDTACKRSRHQRYDRIVRAYHHGW
jgi:hypothetical protein